MGRSRGGGNSNHSTHDDDDASNLKSKRRRVASNGENSETTAMGPGSSEGKKALYHCNYCNKDISGKIRIKCSKCSDFDLCIECFSVGAEVTPHKSNHPYKVMDNLSFPLLCPDWNADEEILLLEGIDMYGLGNWTEIADHIGTKSKAQCIDHYNTTYMNSLCYPLPDMSCNNGKNRMELLAMAVVQEDDKKGIPMLGDVPKEEHKFSPSKVKAEDLGGSSTLPLPSELDADHRVDRSVGIKQPKFSDNEPVPISGSSGYNAKRHEFDPEYDTDAEKSLAEMEFKETDSELDRALKLRVIRIYLSRIDERKRRKDFIIERKLLYPNAFEKDLAEEDRDVYQRFKVFMRFLSQEEYEGLIKAVIEERKIQRRIQELKEYRIAGCRTLAEAKIYSEQKRKRVLETNVQTPDALSQITDNNEKSFNDWNITGFPGADLLSKSEQQLCCENRLLPSQFLKMQEVLVQEILKGSVLKNTDAWALFKFDPSKIDKVYDVVTKKLADTKCGC